MKTQPYICKVHIENFRNFHSVDFRLNRKQVLIGENAVGKSNLLFALQLILDLNLTEKDRMLEESDFWVGLENPMENGKEVLIEVYFADYENNPYLLAQLADTTVIFEDKEVLKLTYKFYPAKTSSTENTEYNYVIFKGDDERNFFTYQDRKLLNIKVIKAIRDVEAEMRNLRTFPLNQVIKQKYAITKDTLTTIEKELSEKGADTLSIEEISDLEKKIDTSFNEIISNNSNKIPVSLKTMNIDATKILYSLRPLIDKVASCRL